eukprot:COSAG04_NODE_924_length_9380_cov_8.463312_5_plen_70_part_00
MRRTQSTCSRLAECEGLAMFEGNRKHLLRLLRSALCSGRPSERRSRTSRRSKGYVMYMYPRDPSPYPTF